jgi:hypothetical protein
VSGFSRDRQFQVGLPASPQIQRRSIAVVVHPLPHDRAFYDKQVDRQRADLLSNAMESFSGFVVKGSKWESRFRCSYSKTDRCEKLLSRTRKLIAATWGIFFWQLNQHVTVAYYHLGTQVQGIKSRPRRTAFAQPKAGN